MKIKQNSFPNKELTNKTEIAKKFNYFFSNIGLNLTTNILDEFYSILDIKFESYISKNVTFLTYFELTEDEFQIAFKSLKRDKAPIFHDVHVNVVKSVFDEINEPLRHIFKNCPKRRCILEKSKIAKILPIF